MRQVLQLLKETWNSWNRHDAPRIGAALAFYMLLSLAPLVLLSIAIGSFFLGDEATRQHLIQQIRDVAGEEAAKLVQSMVTQARRPASGAFASITGVLTLFLGASGVFAELRAALNTIWDIRPRNGNGFRHLVKERLLSIGMVLAIGFLLVVSLIVSTLLAVLEKFFEGLLPVPASALNMVNFLVSFAGIAIMFALILRYVPDARLPWSAVWIGATTTALLFTLGKSLIALYLGRAAIGSPYGAGGSIVVVIAWVYYSAQIFLFGAEFTRVYVEFKGRTIAPRRLGGEQPAVGD